MSQEPLIIDGGESPLASQLSSGATTAAQHLASGPPSNDGGAAPISGQPHASPTAPSADPSGVAASGGIMRPHSK